ncbi:MAG: hypothetical protein LBS23_00325 [Holosporaceae bacterium]|nr:hypothetical protein [Holosporaceae bacterium]
MSVLNITYDKVIKYFHLLLLAVLGVLVAQYGYYLIHNACLTFSDEFILLNIIKGKKIPIIFGGHKRFSVLALQEYWPYILMDIGVHAKVVLTKIHNFIKLVLLLVGCWFGIRKLLSNEICATFACLLILTATPGLFWIYASSVGQESGVVTLWGLWFYWYISACQSGRGAFYFLAVLVATVAFYLKETAFILFLPISLICLAFNFYKLTTKEKYYHFAIVSQVILFFLLYYLCSIKNCRFAPYNDGRCLLNMLEITSCYLRQFPIIIICGIVFITRFFYCVRHRIGIIIADTLVISSLLFVGAYIALQLHAHYYLLPAIVVLHVVLVTYLYEFWKSKMLEKIKAELSMLRIAFLVIFVFLAFVYGIVHYESAYTEMGNVQIERQMIKKLLNKMAALKRTGYTVVCYLPKQEYFADNPFRWHQNTWMQSVLAAYTSAFLDAWGTSLFVDGVDSGAKAVIGEQLRHTVNNKKYFCVFSAPEKLRAIVEEHHRTNRKIAVLIPDIGIDYVGHLSKLGLFLTKTPYFYVYISNEFDCWSDFPKDGIIDVTNLPLNASIIGLSQDEQWGRWSDTESC